MKGKILRFQVPSFFGYVSEVLLKRPFSARLLLCLEPYPVYYESYPCASSHACCSASHSCVLASRYWMTNVRTVWLRTTKASAGAISAPVLGDVARNDVFHGFGVGACETPGSWTQRAPTPALYLHAAWPGAPRWRSTTAAARAPSKPQQQPAEGSQASHWKGTHAGVQKKKGNTNKTKSTC